MYDIEDTIVAPATAAGSGGRAIVRLSGSQAFAVVSSFFLPDITHETGWGIVRDGVIRLPDVASPISAWIVAARGPRTLTGQDVAELHLISCPTLVERVTAACLDASARAARPGEFTLRAFLAGKLDLTAAEAVLGVVEADRPEELRAALAQLAGGVSEPLVALRSHLLDLLADLEAGLDFADEDIAFVDSQQLLSRLTAALAQVTIVQQRLDERGVAHQPFRVVLAGPPNAGKSSLFNALAGRQAALVSSQPGTTRDYLVCRIDCGGVAVELIDTAGWSEADDPVERQAQALGQQRLQDADLVLWCQPIGSERSDCPPGGVAVATKCDLAAPPTGVLATSAKSGKGLSDLRAMIAARARSHSATPLAASFGRCRHHLAACLDRLRQAHAAVLYEDPPEVLAVELRAALDELGELVGAVYTDDLLDRIFSRFCIGK